MDNMPDFDKMTPDEINKWLESLAKRQGATEGFTTAADMDIAEIDPNSVVIDEPGYIPYGQESKQPPKAEPAKAAAPPEPVRPAARVVSTPPPPPVVEQKPQRPAARQEPPPVRPAPPARQEPPPPVRPVQPARPAPPPEPARAESSGLAWLESLAGGQDDSSLFNLDLANLPAVNEEPAAPPTSAPEQISSLSWLEDLARSQDDPFAEPTPPRPAEPFGGSDSVEWLESLARRQGADTEELITPAQLEIPMPDVADVESPGYVAFSFDTPPVTNRAPAPPLTDPSDFLSSLVDETPPPANLDIDEIQRAIATGTVTREQMQAFLEHQADALVNEPEEPLPLVDEDEELTPADLPDWLLEQMGPPPVATQELPTPNTSFDALFPPPPTSEAMPDWLKEEVEVEEPQMDFGTLFGQEPETIMQTATAAPVEIDPNDTWAEAFDLEQESGLVDVDAVPDWYERNVKDPVRIAAVEQLAHRDDSELVDEPLPGEDLSIGEAQGVPSWIPAIPVAEVDELEPVEPAFADWLAELENPTAVEVPDWLTEPLAEDVPVELFEPIPEPLPPPVRVMPPPVAMQPTPYLVGGSAALERARDREQSGDLEGSLFEYEGLIRANIDLDTVVTDLTQLVKSYRTVPAVYRVLGDGLMRQGKLQQALNTYREALNQL